MTRAGPARPMLKLKTIALRGLLALSIGLAVLSGHDAMGGETAASSLALQFPFGHPVDASMAPFFVAAKDGRFGAERLNVSFNSTAGSPEALARVAKGDSDVALVDINELIRFRDRDD